MTAGRPMGIEQRIVKEGLNQKIEASPSRVVISQAFLDAYNAADFDAFRVALTGDDGKLTVSVEAYKQLCFLMHKLPFERAQKEIKEILRTEAKKMKS